MDFKLSGEQLLIKDSVERFVAQRPAGESWAEFAKLGWLAIGAPEELGGSGGPVELMILMEAFGRGLVIEPFGAGAVCAGTILRESGRNDLLEKLIEGERFAVAYEEEHARYDPSFVAATATATSSGFTLDGKKMRVVVPPSAATFIVSAKNADAIALFAVPPGAAGVSRRDFATEDGANAAVVEFDGVPLERDALIGDLGDLETGLDHATGALCAEALGVMSVMHETTLGYLKERTQFGVPIGSFQALQHRMAEMFIELELARSMVYVAAMTLATESDSLARARGISAAKVQVARSGRFIGQNAIQLHGAIAMTEEYKLGHYFKRMTTLERLFGDVDYHLARYVAAKRSPATAALVS
jgi:alkylation response protein AidB-like acyl-CoA dehydrogenase